MGPRGPRGPKGEGWQWGKGTIKAGTGGQPAPPAPVASKPAPKPEPKKDTKTCHLTIKSGKFFDDLDTFGDQDPFVSIFAWPKGGMPNIIGSTKKIDGGGLTPKWNETYTITVDSEEDKVFLGAYDEDDGDDD